MPSSESLSFYADILSIGGAFVAVGSAVVAIRAAKAVRKERAAITGRRQHHELQRIAVLAEAAARSMDKYGPGAGPSSLSGYNPQDDAATVRQLLTAMRQESAALDTHLGTSATHTRNALTARLNNFGAHQTPAGHLNEGKQIHVELTAFQGSLKAVIERAIVGGGAP